MAPITSTLISSRFKKKEPRYVCLSEVKASNSHKMWTEVYSSVPHFLQMGLLYSPMICKCLPKVLCPVGRPMTTLDCILLKDNSRVSILGSGPETNYPEPVSMYYKGHAHPTYVMLACARMLSVRHVRWGQHIALKISASSCDPMQHQNQKGYHLKFLLFYNAFGCGLCVCNMQ